MKGNLMDPGTKQEFLAGALCRGNKDLKTGLLSTMPPRTSEAERGKQKASS